MTVAETGATMAPTGTDFFPGTGETGKTVGRTVWTQPVAVTGMEVGDPDIWIGEKVTTVVVVVNEEVTSWLFSIRVRNFVVLGTRVKAANWSGLEVVAVRTPSTFVR